MRELYQLEIVSLARELDSALKGFFIDKFYELGKGRFRIRLTKSGQKLNLQCILPYAIGLTDYVEASEEATNFAMAVRKRISNFVVSGVEQVNDDRIISIKAAKGADHVNMIFEMFGDGNMIITDGGSKILLAYEQHTFKDREIRVRANYVPPPSNLATTAGRVGAIYAAEAKTRAEGLDSVIAESLDGKAYVYLRDGTAQDFSICRLAKYSGLEAKEFDSLQAALSFFYMGAGSEEAAGPSAEAQKILKSIEKQRGALGELERGAKESREIADYILNNMAQFNILINAARANKRVTKEELQGIGGFDIIEVNLKDKTVRLRSSR